MFRFNYIILLLPILLFSTSNKKCVYINSYHDGFVWSDTIAKEIKYILKDSCDVIQFNMDTKRKKDEASIKSSALQAKKLIDKTNPDVVITSDDNAAKYLIKPYYKDSSIPFVFTGVNWTADKYGFPYSNVTGMIEIIPIRALYEMAVDLSIGRKATFIGDNTITDKKDLSYFIKYSKKYGIDLSYNLVDDINEWKNSYLEAQLNSDFIILGHNSAIKNWNDKKVKDFLLKNSKKLVLATYEWMMPFSMIGLIIKAEEQGQWAANTAKGILNGYAIKNISITTNKTWNNFINLKLVDSAKIKLPRKILIKSKKYDMD
ncbi:ABC transporter substrate-binding protein [Arcobacter sp. LA11]|uniref:ABC transporter substrate-binding protein n=1 Tax=Arcobacter sp. LA11 TaxID=1898176 RepID=UPI000932469B|nr:ABC transporter substrate binding protein [Arcobacter sp. LA11]